MTEAQRKKMVELIFEVQKAVVNLEYYKLMVSQDKEPCEYPSGGVVISEYVKPDNGTIDLRRPEVIINVAETKAHRDVRDAINKMINDRMGGMC